MADATERDGLTESIIDPVTGVYSRALLRPRLDAELARARRAASPCSLFLFDVDFFKTVNDAYGHLRGDEVLRHLAGRVTELVRGYDELFRYGGDEFVLLLPDTPRAEAVRLALTLAGQIRAHEFPGDPPLHVSISLGVATYPDDGADPVALLGCADRRNYLAKARGRGGAVADDVDTGATATSGRLWERDTAMATVHEFLTRLAGTGRGALTVTGQRGSGHTRFLAAVESVARLRGFDVVRLPSDPAEDGLSPSQRGPIPAQAAPVAGPVPARPPAQAPPAPSEPGAVASPGKQDNVLVLKDNVLVLKDNVLVLKDNVLVLKDNVLVLADVDAGPDVAATVAWLDATDPRVLGVIHASVAGTVDTGLPALGTADLTPWSPATLRVWLRTSLPGEPSRALVNWLAGHSGGLPGQAARELARLRERGGLVPAGDGGWTISTAAQGHPRRGGKLPVPGTSLVGREPERAQVTAMLSHGRLVTLVGPGGIGKTRLALAVTGDVAENFDGGAVYVPLAEVTDTGLVVAAIAAALRVDRVPGERLLDSVAAHLETASLLLVLDNFEQVMSAAGVVSELLSAAPGLTVLVTSRERLSLYGERVYQVPPLPLPHLGVLPRGTADVDRALADFPALALFAERARAVAADFVPSPETLPAMAELCHRLDGLPLAIELAAARGDRYRPQELLAHLGDHLDALAARPRDLPARRQTLRGAIDWTVRLLEPPDRLRFTHLAVFPSGCTPDSALAVLSDIPPAEPADSGSGLGTAGRLAALAGRNLLVVDAEPDGGTRYRMLPTVRAYALARLADDPAAGTVRRRHTSHYADLAEQAADGLAGPDQAVWSGRLDREYPNLRAAFAWAMDIGDVDTAARFCLGLWRHWDNGDHLDEGRDWCGQVLTAPRSPDDTVVMELLYAAAVLATGQEDHEAAHRLATSALARAEALGNAEGAARAHNALGTAASGRGDYEVADGHYRQALATWRALGRTQGTAITLAYLTKVALHLGDVDAAEGYAHECLALERAAGNPWNVVLALESLVDILIAHGDTDAARQALAESLAVSRELGDAAGEAMAIHQSGLAALLAGDRPRALRLLVDALERQHDLDDHQDLAVSLDSVAQVVAADDGRLAAELLGAADALRGRYRLPVPPGGAARRQAAVTAARAALDERSFAAARAAGRTAPLEMIIDRLLDALPHQSG